MARHYISGPAAKMDPNWLSVEICFDKPENGFIGRQIADKDACHAEIDYRPSRVILVGPKVGHVLLTEEIFGMIPEPLLILMRTCHMLGATRFALDNPKHEIELIDGKTVIQFENCLSGVVRNVNGDEFDVEHFESDFGSSPCDGEIVHYTRKQLLEEMKMDGYNCQAVDFRYLPYLSEDGKPMNTVEDVREANRIARGEWEAGEPARQAQREAEEAARYAALSPEERAEEDAFRDRMKAQAAIVHALLPHLPQP